MEARTLGDREWAHGGHPGWCIWPSFDLDVLDERDELAELDTLTIEVFDGSRRLRLVSGNFIRPLTFTRQQPVSGTARVGSTVQVAIDPPDAVPPEGAMSFAQHVLDETGRIAEIYPLGVLEMELAADNVLRVTIPADAGRVSEFPEEEGYRWLLVWRAWWCAALLTACGPAEQDEPVGALPSLEEWIIDGECTDTWSGTTLWRVIVSLPGLTDGEVFTLHINANQPAPNVRGCGASASADEEGLIDYVIDCSDDSRETGVAASANSSPTAGPACTGPA